MSQECISLGEYIVIQRQEYKKLHKFSKSSSTIRLGRDTIELAGVEGCRPFSFFKLVARGRSRTFSLEPVAETTDLKESIDVQASGTDNRNIVDDGRSQKLSAADIEELKNDATSSTDIVGTLISNSSTFHSKTGYSQEKYLKKKEKKYFEYVQIRRPNIRLISEILYRQEPMKIQGITMDTLSQMVTLSNISSEGTHLLYDSGSNGLLTATLLNAIGANSTGRLIHLHPGNISQKQALLAMNFQQEQLNRCTSANIYSGLRQYYQGNDLHTNDKMETEETSIDENSRKRCIEGADEDEVKNKIPKLDTESETDKESSKCLQEDTGKSLQEDTSKPEEVINNGKNSEPKLPKWHFDNIAAAEALTSKVDSLVIACKEDPLNIFKELVQFVRPSRPFVIYYPLVEPLQQCYMSLKARGDVAALKLTTNWMRNYQVLPERTHPEVMMNNSSGFLLSGYILK